MIFAVGEPPSPVSSLVLQDESGPANFMHCFVMNGVLLLSANNIKRIYRYQDWTVVGGPSVCFLNAALTLNLIVVSCRLYALCLHIIFPSIARPCDRSDKMDVCQVFLYF